MTDDGYGRAITMIRAGLSLGAVAAIMLALSPFFDIVTGPAEDAARRWDAAGNHHAISEAGH